jgi:NAD(P)-dependent dehydrogenase (short-subunit alcohol dehydrogenase family)
VVLRQMDHELVREMEEILAVRAFASRVTRQLVRRVMPLGERPPKEWCEHLRALLPTYCVEVWDPGSFTDRDKSLNILVHPTLGILALGVNENQLATVGDAIRSAGTTDSAEPAAAEASDPLASLRELSGRVYGVTGAANGIGESISRVLAGQGANLVLADLDGPRLDQLAHDLSQRYGVGVTTVVGDVSKVEVNERIVQTAVTHNGGLDGVVVNAGIAVAGEIVSLEPSAWERCMQVNLFSAFALTQATLRVLQQQGLGGSIVYIASKNAFGPGKGFGAYSVSKAAMVQLARITAIEGGEFAIRSNVVNPDSIFEGSKLWSDEIRKQRAQAHGVPEDQLEQYYAQRNLMQSTISGADVGESVAFLLSERAHRTTGCVITVDGGVAAAFPR